MILKASPSLPQSDLEREGARLHEVLTRAVARVCPAELASQREDIVQAALVRILEMRNRGEEMAGRPASYLWRVAYTTALDELRKTQRRREVRDADAALELPAPIARPEMRLAMTACLGELVTARRQAVALYLHGFAAEEAARTTGWDTKKVQNLIFRGLQDLRRCLTAKGYSP
jgi:RNA polymerase sigma-70 factor (ECF subfamily)